MARLSYEVLRCFVWVVRKFVDGHIREAKKPRIQGARRRTRELVLRPARGHSSAYLLPPPCPPWPPCDANLSFGNSAAQASYPQEIAKSLQTEPHPYRRLLSAFIPLRSCQTAS